MDPITLAIMGAGSLAGGLMNMFGQNSQNKLTAQQIAQQNNITQQQLALQKAGQQDARGNRVRYVEGYGWVTDTTPTTQALLSGEDREKLQQLNVDASMRREALQRNAQVGRELQPAIRDRIAALSGPRTDPRAFAGLTAQAAGNAVQRGSDEVAAAVGRVGARTGNSTSTGNALSRIAENRAQQTSDMILNSIIQGRTAGENIRSSEDARLRNDVTGLIGGTPQVPSFAPVPKTEIGVDTANAAGAASRFDPAGASFAAGRLASGYNPSKMGNFFGDLGLLGGAVYENMFGEQQPRRGNVRIGDSKAVSTRAIG